MLPTSEGSGGSRGKNAHILILAHEKDRFETSTYYMHGLAQIWREQGLKVTVQRGLGPKIEADVLVQHVDLTVIPDEYVAYARQYPVVINGGTVDISKRAISLHLVNRGDGYAGPVIVKTDLNYRGLREAAVLRKRTPFHRAARVIRRSLPWNWRARPFEYQVFPSPDLVPPEFWSNPDLIVEKFLPERSGDEYISRTYHFLGDREICYAVYSNNPIMRPGNILRREPMAQIPEGLRQRRAALKFDFGKIDWVVVEGEVMVYDANRTPTAGDLALDKLRARHQLLAEGIKSFLPAKR